MKKRVIIEMEHWEAAALQSYLEKMGGDEEEAEARVTREESIIAQEFYNRIS